MIGHLKKAIVETSKLKSDCIYYGYEYCDMKGLEVGYTQLESETENNRVYICKPFIYAG